MATLKPPVGAADHHAGNKNASISLVEFGDFQCPHCRRAHPLVAKLLKHSGEHFDFIFRHFPLQEIHPEAQISAMAAEAAGRQGKFWEMHDLIFENQDKLSESFLLQLAERLQLDSIQFESDWRSDSILEKVEGDFESGVRSGVNGTPSFFLNGSPLRSYDGTYESLADAVLTGSKIG